MRKSSLKPRNDVTQISAHRKSTLAEIKFGNGATHYRIFPISAWLDKLGCLKCWIKASDDGLRYYR